MKSIADELEIIAIELDMLFVRAIDVNDLNQRLQNIKVDKPILVYSGLSVIDFDDNLTNYEVAKIETTIYVLDLHKGPDPTAAQIDTLLDPLYTLVNFVYDRLTRSEIIAPGNDIERESLQSSETVELTSENLGGWEMVLTLPLARDAYNCPGEPPLPAPLMTGADVYNVAPERFVMHFDQNIFFDDFSGWRLFVNNLEVEIIGFSLPDNNILILDTDATVIDGDVLKLDYINGSVTNIEGTPLANIFEFEVTNNVQSANSPEADAVIASMPNPLITEEEDSIVGFVNQFSLSLGNDEWNSHLDSFAHFGLHDAINSLQDWKRESAMTNVGSTHTAGVGRSFNGAEYIDSLFIPSVDGVNFKQDNGLYGAFVISGTAGMLYGDVRGFRNTTPSFQINATQNTGGVSDITGNELAVVIRDASNNQQGWKNGVLESSGGRISTAVSTTSAYIGGRNNGGLTEALTGTLSSFIAGAAIGFDHEHYYNQLVILNESLSGIITQTLQPA